MGFLVAAAVPTRGASSTARAGLWRYYLPKIATASPNFLYKTGIVWSETNLDLVNVNFEQNAPNSFISSRIIILLMLAVAKKMFSTDTIVVSKSLRASSHLFPWNNSLDSWDRSFANIFIRGTVKVRVK